MINRIFVEKKNRFAVEANELLDDLKNNLGIYNLTGLRIVNRYDVANLDLQYYEIVKKTVFSDGFFVDQHTDRMLTPSGQQP